MFFFPMGIPESLIEDDKDNPCSTADDLSGARCTRPADHVSLHVDASEPGCVIAWPPTKEEQDAA